MPAPLTDVDIETRLNWLLTLSPHEPTLIRPSTEIRALRQLKAMRARRCTNCEFYAYYDEPLCGFSVDTDESFLWHHDPNTWYCADWKSREGVADASSE